MNYCDKEQFLSDLSCYAGWRTSERSLPSLKQTQSLRSRSTFWIKIWSLSNSHSTIAEALAKALVVECGTMEGASVVPDCCDLISNKACAHAQASYLTNVMRIPPFEPDSQIMILNDCLLELLKQLLRLRWC